MIMGNNGYRLPLDGFAPFMDKPMLSQYQFINSLLWLMIDYHRSALAQRMLQPPCATVHVLAVRKCSEVPGTPKKQKYIVVFPLIINNPHKYGCFPMFSHKGPGYHLNPFNNPLVPTRHPIFSGWLRVQLLRWSRWGAEISRRSARMAWELLGSVRSQSWCQWSLCCWDAWGRILRTYATAMGQNTVPMVYHQNFPYEIVG